MAKFAEKILDKGGSIAIEWPANSGSSKRSVHSSKNAAVGFTSTGECWEEKSSQSRRCGRCQHAMRGLSKPFCSSSVASHMHTKLQKGAKPIRQGFIPCSSAQAILQAWHPKQAFNSDLSCFNHACVTKKKVRAE